MDRRRFPIEPVATLAEDDQRPDDMKRQGLASMYAGATKRWATTSGVAWSESGLLLTTNLLGDSINAYHVDTNCDRIDIRPIRTFSGLDLVDQPSMIDISPDGRRVAVTNSERGSVTLLALRGTDDPDSVDLDTLAELAVPGARNTHGVAFAGDSRHIVWVGIDDPGQIHVVEVGDTDGATTLSAVSSTPTPYGPLKPKGVSFSPDSTMVAVSYGGNATTAARRLGGGFVELRPFDAATGELAEPVARTGADLGIDCAEDVSFSADGRLVVVTDNFGDSVAVVAVDTDRRVFGEVVSRVGRTAGGLRAVHGCAVSNDNRFFTVTNYGDATIRLFTSPSVD